MRALISTSKIWKKHAYLSTAMFKIGLLYLLLVQGATSRSWKDIQVYHESSPRDAFRLEQFEKDTFSFPLEPSLSPIVPTLTRVPTRPTTPTRSPTDSPTTDPYLPNEEPPFPPSSYFNYDVRETSQFGPGYQAIVYTPQDGFTIEYQNNGWAHATTPDDYYWAEFGLNGFGTWGGTLATRDMESNQCGKIGMQSPIDIRLSGVACIERHQIRTLPGDFSISRGSVQKRIESNKLRLIYQRRPCADILDTVCAEPDPPSADFPNGWGGFSDSIHVDFKIPAEHRVYGEVFDAEMQIFHLHPGRRRLPVISVLIRVDPNGYNTYLQTAIDAFQYEYNLHQAQCADTVRRGRRLVTDFHAEIMDNEQINDSYIDYRTWADFSTVLDDPTFLEEGKQHQRRMSSKWHPYNEALIPTYWFYGYDGSLTEPPCTEIVSWFVMDTPMLIAPEQLEQMKRILFTHVDSDCQRTSVHFDESVARPIQETGNRQVWRCTRDDFLPDSERNN